MEFDAIEITGVATLTGRELEIIAKIAAGLQTKEIAERLFISTSTVKAHRRNIIRKMNVPNIPAAMTECLRAGVI